MDSKKAADPNRCRVSWTNLLDKAFIDLMVEHTQNGGKVGTGFKKHAWRDMVVRFNVKMKVNYEVPQLKNRLKLYRREHRIVKAIKDHAEFGWDDQRQVVIAEDSCWNGYVARNPKARNYRHKPMVFFNELEIIFAQNVDVGEEDITEGMDGTEDIEVSDACMESEPTSDDPIAPPIPILMEETQTTNHASVMDHHNKRHRSSSDSTARHVEKGQKRQEVDAVAAINWFPGTSDGKTPLNESVAAEKFKGLDECMSELNAFEDLEDDLYVKALFILRDEYNRHIFLKTSGSRRVAWLRAVTRDVNV